MIKKTLFNNKIKTNKNNYNKIPQMSEVPPQKSKPRSNQELTKKNNQK